MSEPLIFTFTSAIKEGKLHDYTRALREAVEFVEANEPRVIAFETYIDEHGTEATTILIHPDAASQDLHMELAAGKLHEVYEFLDFTKMSLGVYGRPIDAALERLSELADSGVVLRVKGDRLGGFTRSEAERTTAAFS